MEKAPETKAAKKQAPKKQGLGFARGVQKLLAVTASGSAMFGTTYGLTLNQEIHPAKANARTIACAKHLGKTTFTRDRLIVDCKPFKKQLDYDTLANLHHEAGADTSTPINTTVIYHYPTHDEFMENNFVSPKVEHAERVREWTMVGAATGLAIVGSFALITGYERLENGRTRKRLARGITNTAQLPDPYAAQPEEPPREI